MTRAAMLAEAHRLIAADVEAWTQTLDLVMASVLFRQAWSLSGSEHNGK